MCHSTFSTLQRTKTAFVDKRIQQNINANILITLAETLCFYLQIQFHYCTSPADESLMHKLVSLKTIHKKLKGVSKNVQITLVLRAPCKSLRQS